MIRPCFIVFEGLDGAGKTSCARALAEAIGADYLSTPDPASRLLARDLLAGFGGNQEAAQLFYLSTVFDASRKAQAALSAGRSIVLDRYFLSTQVYAQMRGSSLQLDFLGAGLLPADLTIYLDAPLEQRVARLRGRGADAADRETLDGATDGILRRLYREKSGSPVVGTWCTIAVGGQSVAADVASIVARLAIMGEAATGRQP